MSKIEKALQKAKALDGVQAVGTATAGQQDVMSAPGTNLRPYQHDIKRMKEPWQLSVTDLSETRMVYPGMEQRRVAEAFREIRTDILRRCNGSNGVVLVTSIMENGGASFVARNLAAAFAFDESRTALLMDCHLQDPAHQYLVSSQYEFGLTDYLETDTVKIDEIVHPVGIPRFRLIPAGRRSLLSTEHFDSRRMRELITHLKSRYQDRYLVLDVAALGTSPDARVLSEQSDFVILVASYGQVTETELWNAAQSLEGEKFLGVVFNDEPKAPVSFWN
ncbi:MAG: P-loop NTPase family protein [Acidiferrobacteraceae bacterium]